MIIYPDTIQAKRYANNDIVLIFGDKKTETELSFYLTEETITSLLDAVRQQQERTIVSLN
jgi:hypothetical protein